VPGQFEPVHDQWSHRMDAMRYVYMFRFYARLKNVHGAAPTASEVMDIDSEERRERVPAEF
jgi:hypothetical protein